MAQGSVYEVRTKLFIARDLKYITLEICELLDNKIVEVSKMLNSLNQKLKT
ncbi:MAG: four helix bundle protein [Xenococcaceae cyanobacterium]